MRRLLYGLAILPLLAGAASSQPAGNAKSEPMQLSDAQLDHVAGGFFELDRSNTSVTMIEIFQRAYLLEPTGNTLSCPTCYLLIVTPTISVASKFGP